MGWWNDADTQQKEQVIRLLNGETGVQWPFPGPRVRVWTKDRDRARQRIQHGLPVQRVECEVREDRKRFVEHYRQVGQYYEWRDGVNLPSDIRRCGYIKCSKFLLVRNSRPDRTYCSPKCGKNFHALKSTNKKKRALAQLKLKRVRRALRGFGHRSNWKELTARRARVTKKFISDAVRRGDIKAPTARP
jgi:ribosomal protein L44E